MTERDDIEKAVRAAMPATEKVPAIGMSITCNVGGDRQMVLQTFIDQEADDSAMNALADRLMRLAERQQARSAIPALEDEIDQQKRALADYEAQHSELDLKAAQSVAELDEKIIAAKNAVDDEFRSGYDEHNAAGRKGAYEPKGHRASAITAKNAEVDRLFEERRKLAAEKQANDDKIVNTRAHYAAAIKSREDKIAAHRKLVGGE